jgi:UDP-N-acetylglucosamine diphosphorylase / glucose-1-phosphate thymidylyltransferase / UDP-N-acetylgalactosamine diphosphorylase / glucosamine-1-phosphate N-acetyltransferase / galactosamine-1-phosphate N-acetyltransferase
MSAIYLYDDQCARTFEPFALTRPAGEMRAGALLVRERWERALGGAVAGYVTSPHLARFEEPGAPPTVVKGVLAKGSWLVNARFSPALRALGRIDAVMSGDKLAAVRLAKDVDVDALRDGTANIGAYAYQSGAREEVTAAAGWWMNEVWDYIGNLVPMLEHDVPILGTGMSGNLPAGAIRVGTHGVFIEDGAVVEEGVCFDVSAGPVLVRSGAHVQAFTRLVGPVYVGKDSTVTTDRVAHSSIGDVCKVHGEVSNVIFIGHSNKGHDGFVGHSILGRWVNLGAGTITSNLKNTYGTVQLWTPDGIRETGLQFLGTLFGDHAKTGIGLRLTTGTVLGAGANVYGSTMPPKAVAPFSWGEAGSFMDYRLDKFLDVASRMMARRHVTLGDSARAQLSAAYESRWTVSE